jgi:hypothetical protein
VQESDKAKEVNGAWGGHERRRKVRWGLIFDRTLTMFAVGIAFFAILKIASEGITRRDETCKLFERQHAADVQQVAQTIRFLNHPPRLLAGLVVFAEAQLPQTYRDAVASTEPSYCNEPGVGLPEPGPVLPPLAEPHDSIARPPSSP